MLNSKSEEAERLSAIVVDTAYHVHVDLGPGLLDSVYEAVLARALERRGLTVKRQAAVVFEWDGMTFEDGLRIDLLVNDALIIELKSVEKLAPVHSKLPLGLLLNFGAATFKEGCYRVVNGHSGVASSRLRVNQEGLTRSREDREERGR